MRPFASSLPTFSFKVLFQNTECHSRLGSGTGLGNDIQAYTLALTNLQYLIQVGRRNRVTYEVDFGCIGAGSIVQGTCHCFDSSACAQVTAADADYQQTLVSCMIFAAAFLMRANSSLS